jgi:DNA polymerase-4
MNWAIKKLVCPISFALSVNKTVSKIATVEGTAGKPGNTTRETEQFLNPLSIKKIPMVGDVTFQLLSNRHPNIQTLSEMPAEVLQRMIGRTASIYGRNKRH